MPADLAVYPPGDLAGCEVAGVPVAGLSVLAGLDGHGQDVRVRELPQQQRVRDPDPADVAEVGICPGRQVAYLDRIEHPQGHDAAGTCASAGWLSSAAAGTAGTAGAAGGSLTGAEVSAGSSAASLETSDSATSTYFTGTVMPADASPAARVWMNGSAYFSTSSKAGWTRFSISPIQLLASVRASATSSLNPMMVVPFSCRLRVQPDAFTCSRGRGRGRPGEHASPARRLSMGFS